MSLLPILVAWAMAGVFLWAGLEKARIPSATASTLRGLGVSNVLARPVAVALAACEIGVGVCLVFRPDSLVAQLGVVALAASFALAGVIALFRDEPIRCHCFGGKSSGYLGWRQIGALPAWMAAAAVLWLWVPVAPPTDAAATVLLALSMGMAGVRSIQVVAAWRGARGDRESAQEMIVWLR